MSSSSKYDVYKLNIDGSLKKMCFLIFKFNVSECDFCINDGTQKVMNNVAYLFIFDGKPHEWAHSYLRKEVTLCCQTQAGD